MLKDVIAQFHLAGLDIIIERSVIQFTLALGFILGLVVMVIYRLSLAETLSVAVLSMIGYWLSEHWHHVGHALAASSTGHPMAGVRYVVWRGVSLYPANEGDLPGSVHIQRALGGPIASIVLGVLFYGLSNRALDSTVLWVTFTFLAAFNILVMGLGALFPLDFTDGGTIRHWWGRR